MLKKLCAVTVALTTLCGCGELSREELLARVAKDWSLTIRASQVIPVYPLTEDLQPGDLLLVRKTQDEEIQTWQEKGFLPLERHIGRLNLTQYTKPSSGETKETVNLYKATYQEWGDVEQLRNKSMLATLRNNSDQSPLNQNIPVPLAGFPSYSFSIRRNTGLGFALPLQGIPFGLSFLNTDNAFGSVVMKEAFTVGLPESVLDGPVQEWARKNSKTLIGSQPVYLRLITRVYLARDFTVSLSSNQGSGTNLSAGNGGPDNSKLANELNLLLNGAPKESATATSAPTTATPAPAADNPSATPNAPSFGGTLKVLFASANSISLENRFPRPVVVGYRAIDYLVKNNGLLSSPEDTYSRLENKSFSFQDIPACQTISRWLRNNGNEVNTVNQKMLEDWLEKNGGDAIADLTGGKNPELCEKAILDLKIFGS